MARKCSETKANGQPCRAYALSTPDSDGRWRCKAHSTQDRAKDAQKRSGQAGREAGERKRRKHDAKRQGFELIEDARAKKKAKAKDGEKARERAPAIVLAQDDRDLAQKLAQERLEDMQLAARERIASWLEQGTPDNTDLLNERLHDLAVGAALGAIHPQSASAASSALRGIKVALPDPEEEFRVPHYVDAPTREQLAAQHAAETEGEDVA